MKPREHNQNTRARQPTLFSGPSMHRWIMAAARMTVVPGKTGTTVPIKPTAKSTMTSNHQKSSTREVMVMGASSVTKRSF